LAGVHADEQGAVSIETVLIIAAIALPILIFLYIQIRPRLQNYLNKNLEELGVPE
jgi:Flp pilus assembly pilin Flp